MSAPFVDLVNKSLFGYSYVGTISSATTTNGSGVDLQSCDGPVAGVILTGDCGTGQVTVNFTESDDNVTFTAIADSPAKVFASSATANDNTANLVNIFKRSKRYVRAEIVTAAANAILIAVGILAQKKITGSGTGYQS